MIDGALLVDKPVGPTSNAVLQQAKKLLGAAKAGHAGTLDPLASGLLLVLFGEATKLATPLLEDDKEYVATLKLGERTSTADAEGEVLERKPVDVTVERIAAVLALFLGQIEQVPPMHSALKRDGVPLYKLARTGKTVERAARQVSISLLEPLEYKSPHLVLRVRCSKGTYVRTLADDIGTALGTGAHLAGLRRTRSGRFHVESAVTLEELAFMEESARARRLLPLPALLSALPRADLDCEQAARFRQGQALNAFDGEGLRAVFGADGTLIGLGAADSGRLRPVRVLRATQEADRHKKIL